MKEYQKILIDVLKKSISNEKFILDDYEEFEWSDLIKEAKEHGLISLLYYTLSKDTLNNIDEKILMGWKKEVFISNMMQMRHIEQISSVIRKFNENNIPVILLKGLVLRNLYPKSELRSMRDADILVKNKDYSKAKKCLIDCGYSQDDHNNGIHEGFIRPGSLEIEMHFKLVNNDFVDVNFSEYEKSLWDNTLEIEINGEGSRTLGKEDFLIHLVLHMAVHSKYFGFGIRQIYDLALYIKENYDKINWNDFKTRIEKYGFVKYTEALLIIINNLFDISIPDEFVQNNLKEKDVDLFIDNIMRVGVNGKRGLNKDFRFLYETVDSHHYNRNYVLKRLVRCFFPRRDKLICSNNSKYEYIRNNIFLLPVAWIDRINNEYIKKYGLLSTINETKNILEIIKIRNRIIKAFEIPY